MRAKGNVLLSNLCRKTDTCVVVKNIRQSDLNIELIGRRMCIDKVISDPFKRVMGMIQLLHRFHLISVFKNSPRQHSCSKSHGEPKLHDVPCIIQSF